MHSVLHPAGAQAHLVTTLWWWMLGAAITVYVVVAVGMLAAAVRRRRARFDGAAGSVSLLWLEIVLLSDGSVHPRSPRCASAPPSSHSASAPARQSPGIPCDPRSSRSSGINGGGR